MLRRKNIGTEIPARDGVISGTLNSRPPLRTNSSLTSEPIRDELLAGSGPPSQPHSLGKSGLRPHNLDGALKRGNVTFLHEARRYTRNLVGVNKNSCFAGDKEPCTVLDMSVARRKSQPDPGRAKRKKSAAPSTGPDGLTMSQRLFRLMAERDIGQTDLARLCSQYYTAFVPDAEPDVVKQQHIFNIIQGQSSSWVIPLIAAVLEVNELWLQLGIGPKERRPRN